MKAVGYSKSLEINDPESLVDIEVPQPVPHARDLLVKIKAISVNPVDAKVRMRAAPDEGYMILGWDAVGEVVRTGDEVTSFKPGDRVWYAGDVTRDGTNSEFHLVDERIAGKAPDSLSDAEAAAIPLTAITAWELLFDRLGLEQKGDQEGDHQPRLLVVGAAGGVGSILVQLAKQLTNAVVIGTASRPESEKWVLGLGADHVISHRKNFTEELERIGVKDVTHVVSLTHTDEHFDQLVEVMAPQARFGLIDDPKELLDIRKLKQKAISLHWELMFTRSMFQTDDMGRQGEILKAVAGLIDTGKIRTTLGANYGVICAENLRKAHHDIESGQSIGKIVLEGFS